LNWLFFRVYSGAALSTFPFTPFVCMWQLFLNLVKSRVIRINTQWSSAPPRLRLAPVVTGPGVSFALIVADLGFSFWKRPEEARKRSKEKTIDQGQFVFSLFYTLTAGNKRMTIVAFSDWEGKPGWAIEHCELWFLKKLSPFEQQFAWIRTSIDHMVVSEIVGISKEKVNWFIRSIDVWDRNGNRGEDHADNQYND
jgi:hypothetical protein